MTLGTLDRQPPYHRSAPRVTFKIAATIQAKPFLKSSCKRLWSAEISSSRQLAVA